MTFPHWKSPSHMVKLILWWHLYPLINFLVQMVSTLTSSKKCWPIIKHDFYNLCQEFYDGNVCLQSINGSYITLIPKIDGPSKVNDFRPISLLNISMKIITKLLANRLQRAIQEIIHKNQYGFIQTRTISGLSCLGLRISAYLLQISQRTYHS